MADEKSVKDSIYAQIKAIEAWALGAFKESIKKNPNLDDILTNLKMINQQGRKMEWRGTGLERLEENILRERLKKKVSAIRAAAIYVHKQISVSKQLAKAKGNKSPILVPPKSVKIIKELAKEAFDAKELITLFGKGLFTMDTDAEKEDFLRGEGKYAVFDLDARRKLWDKKGTLWPLEGLNLSGIDLNNFTFKGNFKKCDFSGSNLSGCQFIGNKVTTQAFGIFTISECNFDSADLILANFGAGVIEKCTFREATAVKANFSGCTINDSTFSGNFRQANFSNLKGGVYRIESGSTPKSSRLILEKINLEEADFKHAQATFELHEPVSFKNADFRGSDCGLSLDKIKTIKDLYSMFNFEKTKVSNCKFTFYYYLIKMGISSSQEREYETQKLKKLFEKASGKPDKIDIYS